MRARLKGGQLVGVRCDCGRFCRYDAYYARWSCDACERSYNDQQIGALVQEYRRQLVESKS